MPKRKQKVSEYYRSKRHRSGRVERIARPNQFINQLGGWTSNPANKRTKDVLRPVTTTRFLINVTAQNSRGSIGFAMTSIPQSIRNVYQRIRIKKITIFAAFRGNTTSTSTNDSGVLQASLSKVTQIDPDLDPRNVPGAQIKLIDVVYATTVNNTLQGSVGVADVLRCSRMYPPINLDTAGTVGGAPTTKDNYLSTANESGSWTCFMYDLAGIAGVANSVDMHYYFTVELLCNTMKA